MTWVLYVLLMTGDRTLQSVLSSHYFKTEQECNQFFIDTKSDFKRDLHEKFQPRMTKFEIIQIGCMKTTALMEIK